MATSRSVRIPRQSVRVGQGRMDRADLVTTIQGTVTASEAYSTFTTANATPTADGTTPTTLTFTLKDATDTAIASASVTYA